MIFVLIAGSYTPFSVMVLESTLCRRMLTAVWSFAIIGMVVKFFWINCPKWFSSIIYIGMGWLCIFAVPQYFRGMTHIAFGWLLIGGLMYSAGGIIYALKGKTFNARHPNFGSHEVFHLFVMAGSLCHYVLMYDYVA
jgi:hemolysin III